jgi:hypothetical protein
MAGTGADQAEQASRAGTAQAAPWLLLIVRRWALVAALTVTATLRLAFLVWNVDEHPEFFVQPTVEVLSQVSDSSTPYMNEFGFEVSNIACSWACLGRGLASPFGGDTGPTAWIAPGVVAPYAASFSLFGCFTTASILTLFGVALLLSLATCWLTYRSALLMFGDRSTALLAALLFALAPFDLWLFRVASAMELNVYTFLLALLLLMALRYWRSPTAGRLLGLAAATAAAVLIYPGFGLCALTVVALRLAIDRATRVVVHAVLCATVVGVLVSPYVVWQRSRVGGWVPIKSNGPFELYLGNTPEARGVLSDAVFEARHPSQSLDEYLRYRTVGELPYVRQKYAEFRRDFTWQRFLVTTGERVLGYFFTYTPKEWDTQSLRTAAKRVLWALPGVVLLVIPLVRRRTLGQSALVAYALVASFALPFLLAGVMERYRLPVAPVIAILGAALLRAPLTGATAVGFERPGNSG